MCIQDKLLLLISKQLLFCSNHLRSFSIYFFFKELEKYNLILILLSSKLYPVTRLKEFSVVADYIHQLFLTCFLIVMAKAQNASESFARQLDSGHKVNYLWKGNSCPESLVQFPPTPPSALIGGYKDRCDGLVQFHCLPVVAISAIELMSVSRGPQIERFLSQSQNSMSGEVDIKPDIVSDLENAQDEAYCLYSRISFFFLFNVLLILLLLLCYMIIFY